MKVWWEFFYKQWRDHSQLEIGRPRWRRFILAWRMAWCAVFITSIQNHQRLWTIYWVIMYGTLRHRPWLSRRGS